MEIQVSRYNMKKVFIIFFFVVSLILSSCASFLGPTMGSREYTPHSDQERVEFEKANRNVYPDDIRNDISRYKDTTIAWAGIIKEASIVDEKDHMEMIFLVEHHYYDWIEDINPKQEWIWLSPRGEGEFATKWGLKKDTSQSEIQEMTKPGELEIVYGIPQAVEDGVIVIEASYIRGIAERYYTTDKLDYGR